ncbi:hypothetical protein XA68_17155 [Ophiocordyceps unilateralis]|uniref:Uncharacterized protein n=1 Tax=Ophiocordyceps unilateralis TaxID=268505 RepID=A0A2A9PJH5_OPHUN|nr:hypothetical protein XA68_17155 [Ophiocordyceps unilateralis]
MPNSVVKEVLDCAIGGGGDSWTTLRTSLSRILQLCVSYHLLFAFGTCLQPQDHSPAPRLYINDRLQNPQDSTNSVRDMS